MFANSQKQAMRRWRLALLGALTVGLLVLSSVLRPAGADPAFNWSTVAVDPVGTSYFEGAHASIAVGLDGSPAISYLDGTNRALKFAICDLSASTNGNCDQASDWATVTVDEVGKVGRYASITVGANGDPMIAYYDDTNWDLKFAICDRSESANGDCDQTGDWTTVAVDSQGNVGAYTSIAVDLNGNPMISYKAYTSPDDPHLHDLKFATCDRSESPSGNCDQAGDWSLVTVDPGITVGYYTSVAVDANGDPMISHVHMNNRDLKFAICDRSESANGNCDQTGDWSLVTVDSEAMVQASTSIAVDANRDPTIAYYDYRYWYPKFAICDRSESANGDCDQTGDWTTVTLDAAGQPADIAVDANNDRMVSYYVGRGELQGDLAFAICDVSASVNGKCDQAEDWSTEMVEVGGDMAPTPNSIAVGASGHPMISYLDRINWDLKFATGSPPPTPPAAWPMFQHDAQRSGRSPDPGPPGPDVKWVFPAEGEGPGFSYPVVSGDGTVYVGTGLGLYAVDEQGELLWFNGDATGGPIVAPDGRIYAVSPHWLRVLGPDGTLEGEYELGGYPQYGEPVIDGLGRLYYVADCAVPGGEVHFSLARLDPHGSTSWLYDIQDRTTYPGAACGPPDSSSDHELGSAPALDLNGNVYFVYGASVIALNSDGSERWATELEHACNRGNPCYVSISPSGLIYAAITANYGEWPDDLDWADVYALTPDGSVTWDWQQAGHDRAWWNAPAVGSDGTLYLVRWHYGFNSAVFTLQAVSPSGTLQWSDVLSYSGGNLTSPVVGGDGTIYITGGPVHAYAPDGTVEWSVSVSAGAGFAIGPDETLYVTGGTTGDKLYAFGPGLPPTPDADGDGIPDAEDACPGTAAGATVDDNGCSDAQVDADGDGICDPGAPSAGPSGCTGSDACPSEPEDPDGVRDEDGCPDPSPEAKFDCNPPDPLPKEEFVCDASQSTDEDGTIDSYTWNFWCFTEERDPWEESFAGQQVPYSLDADGLCAIDLTVTDNDGQEGTLTKVIEVESFSFAIITDLHIGSDYMDYGKTGLDCKAAPGYDDSLEGRPREDHYAAQRLKAAVEKINKLSGRPRHDIKFVVVLGDVSDSAERSELEKAKSILDGLDVPYYPLLGNHDVWPYTTWWSIGIRGTVSVTFPWCRAAESRLGSTFDDVFGLQDGSFQNFAFSYRRTTFIALDTASRTGASPFAGAKPDGATHDETINFLGLAVNDHLAGPGNGAVVLLSHHPLVEEFIGTEVRGWPVGVTGRFVGFLEKELRRIERVIEPVGGNVLNFAGHIHQNAVCGKGQIIEVSYHDVITMKLACRLMPVIITEAAKDGDEAFIRIVRVAGKDVEHIKSTVEDVENVPISRISEVKIDSKKDKQQCQFTGDAGVLEGASIQSWQWDFGDGKTEQGDFATISHVYPEPGDDVNTPWATDRYIVTLIVEDNEGVRYPAQAIVTVRWVRWLRFKPWPVLEWRLVGC